MAEAEAWVMIPKLDKDKTGCVLDMRPLVLCKDCKHYRKVENAMVANQYCSNLHRAVTNDWFCADGEREDT